MTTLPNPVADFLRGRRFAVAGVSRHPGQAAANAVTSRVERRAATPVQGIVLASAVNHLGPRLVGAAVGGTIGGIVTVAPGAATAVIGSGLAGAVAWVAWRGTRDLPRLATTAVAPILPDWEPLDAEPAPVVPRRLADERTSILVVGQILPHKRTHEAVEVSVASATPACSAL